jgi:excisionase family DNA binding protein
MPKAEASTREHTTSPHKVRIGERYINATALARRWAVSLPHIYRMAELQRIRSFRFGNAIRFAIEDVERIEARGGTAA